MGATSVKRRTSNGGVKGGGDERGGPHTEPGPGSQPPEASREVQGSGGGASRLPPLATLRLPQMRSARMLEALGCAGERVGGPSRAGPCQAWAGPPPNMPARGKLLPLRQTPMGLDRPASLVAHPGPRPADPCVASQHLSPGLGPDTGLNLGKVRFSISCCLS